MFDRIIASIYLAIIKYKEKKIGYKISFGKIPNEYIQSMMVFDMTAVWKKHGIKATGINYFTLGEIQNNLSSRFDKDSSAYQSWLGCYLVQFKDDKNFTLQDHINLANADQINWLEIYGDRNPVCDLNENNFESKVFKTDKYACKFYEGGGTSHSEVGEFNNNVKLRWLMFFLAMIVKFRGNLKNLFYKNFIPNVEGSYEVVTLRGYIAIFELDKKTKLVLYGNGTDETWFSLKDKIEDAFKSVQIQEI